MFLEFFKFFLFSIGIVLVSKYLLVTYLRKLADLISLDAKTTGGIAGIATSVPELLAVISATSTGLIDTSIYNILSSNIINTLQFFFSAILSKNLKELKNKIYRTDFILVAMTILIPIILILTNTHTKFYIIPLFLLLFFVFYKLSQNSYHHIKAYYHIKDTESGKNLQVTFSKTQKNKKVVFYLTVLGLAAILLYILGNLLGTSLENLFTHFRIPELILGIALGFITSLPELITFFEAQKHHNQSVQTKHLGLIEANNNLLSSNILNLFMIQTVGILIYLIV